MRARDRDIGDLPPFSPHSVFDPARIRDRLLREVAPSGTDLAFGTVATGVLTSKLISLFTGAPDGAYPTPSRPPTVQVNGDDQDYADPDLLIEG